MQNRTGICIQVAVRNKSHDAVFSRAGWRHRYLHFFPAENSGLALCSIFFVSRKFLFSHQKSRRFNILVFSEEVMLCCWIFSFDGIVVKIYASWFLFIEIIWTNISSVSLHNLSTAKKSEFGEKREMICLDFFHQRSAQMPPLKIYVRNFDRPCRTVKYLERFQISFLFCAKWAGNTYIFTKNKNYKIPNTEQLLNKTVIICTQHLLTFSIQRKFFFSFKFWGFFQWNWALRMGPLAFVLHQSFWLTKIILDHLVRVVLLSKVHYFASGSFSPWSKHRWQLWWILVGFRPIKWHRQCHQCWQRCPRCRSSSRNHFSILETWPCCFCRLSESTSLPHPNRLHLCWSRAGCW